MYIHLFGDFTDPPYARDAKAVVISVKGHTWDADIHL